MKYVAAIDVKSPTTVYRNSDPSSYKRGDLRTLFEVFDFDTEEGKSVEVTVLLDGDNRMYDFMVNGESAGYYFIKVVCSLFADFHLPVLAYLGYDSKTTLDQVMKKTGDIYILPAFGDLSCM